jgi:hypothetical protein
MSSKGHGENRERKLRKERESCGEVKASRELKG